MSPSFCAMDVDVLNLHMGCKKGLLDQRFRLCADAFYFFSLAQLHSLARLVSQAQQEENKENPLKIQYYSTNCRKNGRVVIVS